MKRVLTILLCCLMAFGLSGCGKSKVEDAKKNLQESYEKYGFIEKDTVDVLVAKFNTEVVDHSSLNVASTDYLTKENNQYWYGLLEGVSLVIVPEKYTGDQATDIVDYMLIFVNKTSKYNDEALTYTKNLLKQIIIKQRILRLIHYSKKQKINRVVVKQHIMEKAFQLVI